MDLKYYTANVYKVLQGDWGVFLHQITCLKGSHQFCKFNIESFLTLVSANCLFTSRWKRLLLFGVRGVYVLKIHRGNTSIVISWYFNKSYSNKLRLLFWKLISHYIRSTLQYNPCFERDHPNNFKLWTVDRTRTGLFFNFGKF